MIHNQIHVHVYTCILFPQCVLHVYIYQIFNHLQLLGGKLEVLDNVGGRHITLIKMPKFQGGGWVGGRVRETE